MKDFLFGLVFNIIETVIVFLIGLIFEIEYNHIICLMIIFFLTRMLCGNAKHYNKWYKCFLWSTLTFTSVYALTDLNILANILLTIFSGYIATGKADLTSLYQWKKTSNYSDIEDYIKYNGFSDDLKLFEEKLKRQDSLLYLIYKYRFKDCYTFAEISERTELETPRIAEKLEKIAFSIRIFCGI